VYTTHQHRRTLDAQGKIRVWIDVPEEPSEEPEASILVAERGVASVNVQTDAVVETDIHQHRLYTRHHRVHDTPTSEDYEFQADSTAVGLDAQGKIRVWIDVPEEPSEEPEASILVAERGRRDGYSPAQTIHATPPCTRHTNIGGL
jgi:hypothetical protein